jgi:Tfp pilus assembly protein PilE
MKNKPKFVSLIEWFCITVIVTVLAAMILPSFLPFSVDKACALSTSKSMSVKQLMDSINRAQQVYYVEHGHFATSMQQLERSREVEGYLPSRTLERIKKNREISIKIKDDIASAYAVAKYINPNQNSYSYVAATTVYGKTDNDQRTIQTICRTLEPSTAQPAAPILQESQQFLFWRHDTKLVCSAGTEDC